MILEHIRRRRQSVANEQEKSLAPLSFLAVCSSLGKARLWGRLNDQRLLSKLPHRTAVDDDGGALKSPLRKSESRNSLLDHFFCFLLRNDHRGVCSLSRICFMS